MWAAPVAALNGNTVVFVVFFIFWSAMMGTYLHFCSRVAPAALGLWAEAEGYQVLERKWASAFDWFPLVLGSLLVCGLCADEIWPDSLGLNRLLHRTPGSHSPAENWQILATSFSYSVLNLPALMALTAGGIGMMKRRPWGYWCHVAGSALVAVTCFGLAYTIPALAFALQPEFQQHFRDPKATKTAPDPFGDL